MGMLLKGRGDLQVVARRVTVEKVPLEEVSWRDRWGVKAARIRSSKGDRLELKPGGRTVAEEVWGGWSGSAWALGH